MSKHPTRKEHRAEGWPRHLNPKARTKAKRALKSITRKRSRQRPLDDETPYKKLDDPWNHD